MSNGRNGKGTHMTKVTTYQHAYIAGTTNLCRKCFADGSVRDRFPSLGPVSHGMHRGVCDGCESASQRRERVVSEVELRRPDLDLGDGAIGYCYDADPTATADEIIEALVESTAEHAANLTAAHRGTRERA